MLMLLTSALLAAEPTRLAVPDFVAPGFSPEAARTFTEHAAQHLTGVRVVTQRDIAAMLGIERQRQLLGCSEDSSSCMAELAAALGAELVLNGEVSKIEDVVQVTMTVIRASNGQRVATFSQRVRDVGAVMTALEEGGRELSRTLSGAPGRAAIAAPIAAGVVALGLAAAGTALYLSSGADHRALLAAAPPSPTADPERIRSDGELKQGAAIACFIGAGVAAAATVVLAVVGLRSNVSIAPAPGGGGTLLFAGTLP